MFYIPLPYPSHVSLWSVKVCCVATAIWAGWLGALLLLRRGAYLVLCLHSVFWACVTQASCLMSVEYLKFGEFRWRCGDSRKYTMSCKDLV